MQVEDEGTVRHAPGRVVVAGAAPLAVAVAAVLGAPGWLVLVAAVVVAVLVVGVVRSAAVAGPARPGDLAVALSRGDLTAPGGSPLGDAVGELGSGCGRWRPSRRCSTSPVS